jgi:biopolymer transport protein ExbD
MEEDDIFKEMWIDITSLAAVALLLVIIFLGTANSWNQPLMKVDLPKASTAESERKQNLTVSIGPNNELAIDNVNVPWQKLFDGLAMGLEENKDKFVIIRADKKARYGRIIYAMDVAKKAGARELSIATMQKGKNAKELE